MKSIAKIALIGLVALACERNQQFPDEPFVRLEEYVLVGANEDPESPNEHLRLKFYFTDGDGNIGLEDNQLSPPHCETCDHYYNLFVHVYSKEDGVFELTYPYHSRIKNLTPNAQYQSLEGHMIYKIDITNRTSDTVMVDFYLEDRDLNASNLEMTPEVFVDL
jgi:hypothetical protein